MLIRFLIRGHLFRRLKGRVLRNPERIQRDTKIFAVVWRELKKGVSLRPLDNLKEGRIQEKVNKFPRAVNKKRFRSCRLGGTGFP